MPYNLYLTFVKYERPVAKTKTSNKQVMQSNLDYPDPDYPDYSIIRTFFSGPNFSMNIN